MLSTLTSSSAAFAASMRVTSRNSATAAAAAVAASRRGFASSVAGATAAGIRLSHGSFASALSFREAAAANGTRAPLSVRGFAGTAAAATAGSSNSNSAASSANVEAGMQAIFAPKSVCVVGATDRPGSVGRTIVANLISCGEGKLRIYPVNPTRDSVQGLKCVKSVPELPEAVDLAVLVTPAKSCVEVMQQCADKGVKSVIVISAGFKEAGPEGVKMEERLIEIARSKGIRVIGPNCLGVMSPVHNLNASFAATSAKPGPLAFISQSGAMCTAVLDWSLAADVGFSAFVSVGSMADVDWGDLITYLAADDSTKAILIYMEAIGNAEAFMKAAQKVGCKKPIIVIKSGKSEQAAKAAASHTGSLAGSYASFQAAMDRVGALTVDTIGELFNMAYFLAKQPCPTGPNLVIVSNAGGPAVLATDAAVGAGAEIGKVSDQIVKRLNAFLPAAWSHSNPVDILGDAPAHLYAKTLEVVLDDPSADGVLVVLSPQDVTDPTATAKALVAAVDKVRREGKLTKPVFGSWMGGQSVAEGAAILSDAGIPSFAQADDAAATFGRLYKLGERARKVAKMPQACSTEGVPETSAMAKHLLAKARKEGRPLLTEAESKQLLESFGVACVPTIVATTKQSAVKAAQDMSERYKKFAVKLNSETITHKADVGGVKLNVQAADVGQMFDEIQRSVTELHSAKDFQGVTVQPMVDLSKGIELILGSTNDAQFGPLVMFGSGGTMVEIFKDTALGVPPFDSAAAMDLMSQTKIFKALKGAQGKRFEGVNLEQLSHLVASFSKMIVALKDQVAECDINPLLSMKNEALALDARIALKKQ